MRNMNSRIFLVVVLLWASKPLKVAVRGYEKSWVVDEVEFVT